MILQKQHCVQIYFGDTHVLPWQCGLLCLEYAGLCRAVYMNSPITRKQMPISLYVTQRDCV